MNLVWSYILNVYPTKNIKPQNALLMLGTGLFNFIINYVNAVHTYLHSSRYCRGDGHNGLLWDPLILYGKLPRELYCIAIHGSVLYLQQPNV